MRIRTLWPMEPGVSMPQSQGLSNNSYPEPNQIINRVPRPCVMFLNKDDFYCVRLLASRQTPKLEDHSWSTIHDYLFNIFSAKLHIWRPTPPSATRGDAPCRGDRNPRLDLWPLGFISNLIFYCRIAIWITYSKFTVAETNPGLDMNYYQTL